MVQSLDRFLNNMSQNCMDANTICVTKAERIRKIFLTDLQDGAITIGTQCPVVNCNSCPLMRRRKFDTTVEGITTEKNKDSIFGPDGNFTQPC